MLLLNNTLFFNDDKGTIYYGIKKYFRIYFCRTLLNIAKVLSSFLDHLYAFIFKILRKCCILEANKT